MQNGERNFLEIPVLDAHIHFGKTDFMPGLLQTLDRLLVDKFNIVCTPDQTRLSLVPDALYLKAHYPKRAYVFGGMDISALMISPEYFGSIYADYIEVLLALGCDGVKMIEGKPQIRKMLPIPAFDCKAYAPFWKKMEEWQVPLIFHVNDPEEFWDAQKIPSWARERGWFYGDGSYINNEKQYSEVLNVMARHPNLKVIFAHFFFLSAQLERLSAYLERYPNLHIDLTPGIEMYFNFSSSPQKVKEFFIKYQDRIIFGTDIGAKALLSTPELGIEFGESRSRVNLVRSFMELDEEFWLEEGTGFLFGKPEKPFQGIGLPPDVLEKVYYRNFEKLAGETPRPISPAAILAECERLKITLQAMASFQPQMTGDLRGIEQIIKYFYNLEQEKKG